MYDLHIHCKTSKFQTQTLKVPVPGPWNIRDTRSSYMTSLWSFKADLTETSHWIQTKIFSDAHTRAIHGWPHLSAPIGHGRTASSRVWVSCNLLSSSCACVHGYGDYKTSTWNHPFQAENWTNPNTKLHATLELSLPKVHKEGIASD